MKVCVKFARENLWKNGLWKMDNGLLAFKGGNQQLEMLPIYVENLPNWWVRMCCLCLWNIMEMIICPFWSRVKKIPKLISWSFLCVHVLFILKNFLHVSITTTRIDNAIFFLWSKEEEGLNHVIESSGTNFQVLQIMLGERQGHIRSTWNKNLRRL